MGTKKSILTIGLAIMGSAWACAWSAESLAQDYTPPMWAGAAPISTGKAEREREKAPPLSKEYIRLFSGPFLPAELTERIKRLDGGYSELTRSWSVRTQKGALTLIGESMTVTSPEGKHVGSGAKVGFGFNFK